MRARKISSTLFCLILAVVLCTPVLSQAQDKEEKTVKVGWYESAFHHTDGFGRRSGYGYEYQMRIATYTGWNYEYVEGSWSELLEKLIDGEIDLLSDVSYTKERAEKILYSAEAMGGEGYHVFIAPENTEIRPDDFSSLNGKKVGVNKNSIQETLFMDWMENHGVKAEVIESTEKTPVLLQMLSEGEFDALVTLDTYGTSADIVPVWNVGYAQSFFGINKARPDLKEELDLAMSRLFEENRDFNQEMTEKFNRSGSISSFLTTEEREWLGERERIRVGYRENTLPYCASDENGSLTGALADFLKTASTCEKNAVLSFEPMAYDSVQEAINALTRGEVDCVFPVSLSSYDGEQMGIVITDPVVETGMYAVVSTSDRQGISPEREMKAAVLEGHPSHISFVKDYFPLWETIESPGYEESMKKIEDGEWDVTLISSYRISPLTDLISQYELAVLPTGESMEIGFAVRKGDDALYSILNKVIRLIPESAVNASLTNYGFKEEKVSFGDFVRDNLLYFLLAVALISGIILLLVRRNLHADEQVKEGREIISEAERDELTKLYNKNFFQVYANRIYREDPGRQMDAVVINIDRFHSVNALHGREFGDQVLCALGEEIGKIAEASDGIASRFEADRFDIFCLHREDWQTWLEQLQARMDEKFHNAGIYLRMGVKPWQEGQEPVVQFDRARTACNRVRGDCIARVVVYDEVMGKREERDQRLLNDFGRALENRELEVFYQPKYNIRSEKPVLSSAEALVRWNHPELGFIRPDEFVSLFEKSGQISALDGYVWEETARQIADWRDKLGIVLPVSVNLSRVDVFNPELIQTLDRLLRRYGLSSRELKLEVTESAYTENASQLIRVIHELRSRGYEIEMDDFGSGYSSLNMLSSIPVDILKMDIAFIRNIERNEKDRRLVELIVDIARCLKVPVIAEGVENERQLSMLKAAGCDLVQGYYFSRPLPAGEFEEKILGGLCSL